ncbi:rhodanese-like domain-containing protein [Sulfuricystis multivorans]|uniref:rhodanese-like domain-containing protein n=1 Tax=Sulfuricystis multivorans TaxID=2211108 RepID=UPI000F835681|nr:rhodanese-like domain-containing protein [Sulfuricystis multivorans]
MKQMTAAQLKEWLDDPKRPKPILLDVREPWEFDVVHIPGAKLMPMRSVPARYPELDRNAEIVVICHHGARSYQVAMFLEHQGFPNIINLYGGMAAWSRDVDPSAPTY